ncbi:MAG: TonB-dependent receptor [Acidobacteria bacterium]|nr:TonB-dependent receptor [Acidobacteriota bacterium]
MQHVSHSRRLATSILGLALLHLPLSAQTSRGTISGLVSDPSAAPIAAAKVELRSVEQNTVRTTESNPAGIYRFDAVDPGQYRLAVSMGGFKVFQTQFSVSAAQVLTYDVRLEVGDQTATIEVTAEAAALQVEAPVRGGSITAMQASQLPVATRNPNQLALLLPGVSTTRGAPGGIGSFSVNGSRGRSNNFLLDGTENNDISIAGQAFQVTNPDAVAEVSVQTTNFDAEFGRAGGAVVNTITRSGTNEFHGTANYLVESTRFNAITNTQALSPAIRQRGRPPAGTDQWFSGTLGGPILKNQTFFFASYLENRQQSTSTQANQTLSTRGRETLRRLFPQGANKNVDLYFNLIGDAAATGQFGTVALGLGRPDLEIGTFTRSYAQRISTRQPIIKVDHRFSDRSIAYGRLAYDGQNKPVGGSVRFAGFDTPEKDRFINALFGHTYVFSPTVTNELRIPYNRITLDFPGADNPLALTAPDILIRNGSARVGMLSSIPQGRIANNYVVQDTVTVVRGRHTFRGGIDLLQQRSRQFAPFAVRGTLTYEASTGFSSWGNFIDDFGGSAGAARKDFGNPAYYPNLNRHAYFVQDRWRASDSLTLTLGVRYEYFGLPMNSIRTPAYTGLFNVDPVTLAGPYSQPNRVTADRNNFSPSVGLAWSPSKPAGPFRLLFGEKKGVLRMGYQMGYDSFFNNIASNAQASSPNLVATDTVSVVDTANPRGLAGLSGRLPVAPRALSPLDAQTLMLSNLVNPYYQKWSLGIQRELPAGTVLDVSYVGTKGTRLFINEDANPLVPPAFRIRPSNAPSTAPNSGRLDTLQGDRTVRTNGGSSNYHGLQTMVHRRFQRGFMAMFSHTWSKAIDNGSEIFATTVAPLSSLPAVPAFFGGQARERSVSFFHRDHRAVLTTVYDLPWMKSQQGFAGRVIGGWQVAAIYTYETGIPYSVVNGIDADGFGGATDRPNFNPNGRKGVRAVWNAASPTGYVNPDDRNTPIDPSQARFLSLPACNVTANPRGCPTGNLGRNTERNNPLNVWNVNFMKTVNVNERYRFEFRTEMFNLFNKPQYGFLGASAFAPATGTILNNVASAPSGQFANPQLLDAGGRMVRFQLKLLF